MPLATLSIDLEARLANLQTGFDKAARIAEKNANQIEARYNKLGAAAAGIGAALAASFSVGAFVQFFRATADGLDKLNDLKDATGATVENISALEDVALRTGTSIDTVATSLVKFNLELSKADAGSETANILKQIGLSAAELRAIDPAEALRRTAVALAQYADDGNKARITQALFGKSIKEVAPFLKDLAEQGQLNATVTTAQAQAAEDFNKQLFALQANATGAARAIAGPFMTAVNGLAGDLKIVSDETLTLQQRLAALFQGAKRFGFGALFGLSPNEPNPLADAREQLQAIETALKRTDITDARRADLEKKRIGRLETIKRLLADDNFGNEGNRPKRTVGGVPTPDKKPPKPKTDKVFEGTPIDDTTLAALKRLQDTDTAKLGALRLELQALIELRADTGAGGIDEAMLDIEEAIARLDPVAKAAAESAARLNALLDATPTAKLAEVLKDVALLNAAFERGNLPAEQWAEAIRASVSQLPQDTAKALDEMSEFTKQFQRNVQDAMGSTIRDTLRGDFDNIGDLWKNMLIDMASQAIAADLGNRLFGDKAKGGSNAGYLAALAALFGFAKGGAFGSGGSVMAFADGGVLTRATPFGMSGGRMGVAGEAGPEAVLPLKRGADGKLGVASSGGGGITINVAAGVTRGEVVSAIQLGMQSVKGDIYQRLQAQRVI